LANEELLVRALRALLETAVKFSGVGETVQLGYEVAAGPIKFIIESQGKIIPNPVMPNFFDIFSVSEVSTPGGDLGLGPAVASRILSLFDGSVTVANRDDPSGIRLTVSLKEVKREF